MLTKAQQLKQNGNDAFQNKEYEKAIKLYTEAIEEDNTQSIFYSNRAACYHRLKKYQDAVNDATMALELDDKNIKGHLLAGQNLCMIAKEKNSSEKIDTAIQRILKARTLCAGQKKSDFEKQIDDVFNKAKKLKWFIQFEEEQKKNQEIVKKLIELVKNDQKLTQQEKQTTLMQIDKYIVNEKPQLKVPEYLRCQISGKLLIDPYTTETGYSYEKNILFQTPLNQDPKTNKLINKEIIYPNINLKQAASEFLSRNPWAYDYLENQTLADIEL